MENVYKNLNAEQKKEMAKDVALSSLKMFANLFELGCEVKVDKGNNAIQITGYDELDDVTYGLEEDVALRERTYQIDFEEGESGEWVSSNFTEVLDCISNDSMKLGIIPF